MNSKPDAHKGTIEGDHRSDKEQGNKNAVGAVDKNGLPEKHRNESPARSTACAYLRQQRHFHVAVGVEIGPRNLVNQGSGQALDRWPSVEHVSRAIYAMMSRTTVPPCAPVSRTSRP